MTRALGHLGFVLLGILLAGIGIWLHRRTRAFVRRARTAQGQYVGARRELTLSDSSQATSYAQIEFRTESGQLVHTSSRVGTPFEGRKAGRPVEVLYDPANPEEAVVKSTLELWLPSLIFIATGVLMSLFALGFWLIVGPR